VERRSVLDEGPRDASPRWGDEAPGPAYLPGGVAIVVPATITARTRPIRAVQRISGVFEVSGT
jgi:hypothetical protein